MPPVPISTTTIDAGPAIVPSSKPLSLLPDLDASKLQTTLTTSPKPLVFPTNWASEDATTDHMIIASWSSTTGWSSPHLTPTRKISLPPASSVLHYATTCFEGLKAYRGHDGKLRLFRASHNTARFAKSAARIALPVPPQQAVRELIDALLAVDGPKWVSQPGTYLYLRPTLIGTGKALGVHQPVSASFMILATLFPVLDKPLKLLASDESMVRAWPGGFGAAKVGANYGPTLAATKRAVEKGYGQVLWLLGDERRVTEAGASNFFVVWRTREGGVQMVTAPTGDGIILDGVTRRSVVDLARERLGDIEVVERTYTISEMVEAWREGRLLEAFASGTAYFVARVEAVRAGDVEMTLEEGKSVKVMDRIKTWLQEIMFGKVDHPWAEVVAEKAIAFENAADEEVEKVKEELRRLRKSKAWLKAWEEVAEEDEPRV